jgi:hypothetical protein
VVTEPPRDHKNARHNPSNTLDFSRVRCFPGRVCPVLAAVGLALVSGGASAEPGAALDVERTPEAESCPDGVEFNRLVEGVRGHTGEQKPPYRVRFEHANHAYQAHIVGTRDHSERHLSDEGATCAALARATAVTLALLVDAAPSDAAAKPLAEESTRAKAPRMAPPPAVPPSGAVQAPLESSALRARAFTIQAGGALLAGSVRALAFGPTAGVGLRLPSFYVGLNAVWLVPQPTGLGEGHVTTSYVGAAFDACVAARHAAFVRLDVCSGFSAGFVRGEARGYTTNDARSRPWLALPFALALRSESAALGWEVGLAALVPIRRQDFAVDGVGVAYRALPIAGFLWLRGVGSVRW